MMKAKCLLVAMFLVSLPLQGSELSLRFTAGWSPSYDLKINFDTGAVVYSEDKADAPHLYQLPNRKNVGLYVRALAEKIPAGQSIGTFGDDFPVYRITFTDGKFARDFTIGVLAFTGAVSLNEGYSAEKELKEDATFVKNIQSWFLCNLLNSIVDEAKRAKPFGDAPLKPKE